MKQTLIAAIAMVSVASADMASLKADLLEEQESLNKLDIASDDVELDTNEQELANKA